MAYTNDQGIIVGTKTIKEKNQYKKYIKDIYNIGTKFTYVGKTKNTGARIVFYEGKILEKLDGDLFRVEFIDRNIYGDKLPFEKIIPKNIIHIDYK